MRKRLFLEGLGFLLACVKSVNRAGLEDALLPRVEGVALAARLDLDVFVAGTPRDKSIPTGTDNRRAFIKFRMDFLLHSMDKTKIP